MRCLTTILSLTLAFWHIVISNAQDIFVEVIITRGTTGLGIRLVSETRGKGAVVDRVIPESAASLVLRAGDVVNKIAGVEVTQWSLDNINRLLGVQERVKIRVRRPGPEPRSLQHEANGIDFVFNATATGRDEHGLSQEHIRTASCYATVDGDTSDLHPFACSPAAFGKDLHAFSNYVFPVAVADPLEHCTRNQEINATGFALLVSRGGCLPAVKARNAAGDGAEVMILVEGQFPPFPPLPSAATCGKDKKLLAQQTLTTSSPKSKKADIPVLIIGNATGQRIISEVRDHGRDVVILSHAGTPPIKLAPTPPKQIPLDESESLQLATDAFGLKSVFRDGQVVIDFGQPGLSRGKTQTIFLQVPCELSVLLTGEHRVIAFERTVRCPLCGGRGAPAAEMRPCKFCSDSDQEGVLTVAHHHSRELEQTLTTTCRHCNGFGEMPKRGRTCRRCKGERVSSERVTLEIHIPEGAPDGHRLHFPGRGSHDIGRTEGDVEVELKIESHDTFTREGPNLRAELPISLTEALSGFTREIQLLNGTVIPLNISGITKHNDEIEVFGGGLPLWDPAAARKRKDSRSNRRFSNDDAHASSPAGVRMDDEVEPSAFGSAIFTCIVNFPDTLRGRVKDHRDNDLDDYFH